MAKETNKSTTIILLVIAGALLFLAGSVYTGMATTTRFVGEGQKCGSVKARWLTVNLQCSSGLSCNNSICVKTPTTSSLVPTTELTTQQKQSVLDMLNSCTELSAMGDGESISGDTICNSQQMKCIVSFLWVNPYGPQEYTYYALSDCDRIPGTSMSIHAMCCQP